VSLPRVCWHLSCPSLRVAQTPDDDKLAASQPPKHPRHHHTLLLSPGRRRAWLLRLTLARAEPSHMQVWRSKNSAPGRYSQAAPNDNFLFKQTLCLINSSVVLPGAQHFPKESSPSLHHSRAPRKFIIPAAKSPQQRCCKDLRSRRIHGISLCCFGGTVGITAWPRAGLRLRGRGVRLWESDRGSGQRMCGSSASEPHASFAPFLTQGTDSHLRRK